MNIGKFPVRKQMRLKNYDYSQNGCYFITICTENKKPILSKIVTVECGNSAHRKEIILNNYGRVVEKYINSIHSAYNTVFVENYIIMPNHIHILLLIDTYGQPRVRVSGVDLCEDKAATESADEKRLAPTVSNVISAFKHITNRKVGFNLWQSSFYDHIIRNETDFQNTWNYIEYNALKEYGKQSGK